MNSPTPQISIGLPVFNGGAYLRAALDSLLAQTLKDFELVISDNASTDDTGEICAEYAVHDSRIRYVRQPVNRGAPANFQYTLDEARGKYFVWAACDDWWDKCFLEDLAALLDKVPEAVIAFCRFTHVDSSGRTFRDYPCITQLGRKSDSPRAKSSFESFMLQRTIHGKVNLIYGLMRTDVLRKANVWRRWGLFGWGADLLMVSTILRYGDVVFTEAFRWKKTENPSSEGSLRPSKARSPLWRAGVNAARMYSLYLKYCRALWTVQGPLPGLRSVRFTTRLFLTCVAVSKLSADFLWGATRALGARVARIRQGAFT